MKKKISWVVFHTTESGADYKVFANPSREKAVDWELENRDKYERPLIIMKITY